MLLWLLLCRVSGRHVEWWKYDLHVGFNSREGLVLRYACISMRIFLPVQAANQLTGPWQGQRKL